MNPTWLNHSASYRAEHKDLRTHRQLGRFGQKTLGKANGREGSTVSLGCSDDEIFQGSSGSTGCGRSDSVCLLEDGKSVSNRSPK